MRRIFIYRSEIYSEAAVVRLRLKKLTVLNMTLKLIWKQIFKIISSVTGSIYDKMKNVEQINSLYGGGETTFVFVVVESVWGVPGKTNIVNDLFSTPVSWIFILHIFPYIFFL